MAPIPSKMSASFNDETSSNCNEYLSQSFIERLNEAKRMLLSPNYLELMKRKPRLRETLNRSSPSKKIPQRSRNYSKSPRFNDDMNASLFATECDKFLSSLQLSSREIDLLQTQTIGQSTNWRWKKARKNRLTASNFGRIYKMRNTTLRCVLVKELLSLTPKSCFAMDYGSNNEKNAIAEYEMLTKTSVKPCGLFVHPEFGYLGASPDGLVGGDGIVEVKCPYSAQHLTPIQAAARSNSFYCTLNGDSELRLKTNHHYYYQVQGQLEITGRKYCDFVVWSPRGMHVERIWRDKSVWETIFPKLEVFYKQSMLPEIVDPRSVRGLPIREPDFVLEAIEIREAKRAANVI